jgi:hypothetical protein
VANVFYGGVADFNAYHNEGAQLAVQFSHGTYKLPPGRIVGLEFVKIITGAIYTVTGISELAATFVYAFIGFLGLFLFYRAFCIAFPGGSRRRYAAFIFLWPTVLFWTSAISKDALMALALGASAYGAARVLRSLPLGFTIVAAGSMLGILVRPWMPLMFCAGLACAYAVRRPKRPTASSRIVKFAALALLLVFGLFLAGRTSSALRVESLNASTVNQVLNRTTAIGAANRGKYGNGSHFAISRNPLKFPISAFTVLFRPLPFEASGVTSLGASMESLILLGIVYLAFRPALIPAARNFFREPYVVLIAAYLLLGVFVFSAISDFGDLVRQRAQMLPFLFMLLAYTRTPLRREPPKVLISPGWRELAPRPVG